LALQFGGTTVWWHYSLVALQFGGTTTIAQSNQEMLQAVK